MFFGFLFLCCEVHVSVVLRVVSFVQCVMCNSRHDSRFLVPVVAGLSFSANNNLSPLSAVGRSRFNSNCSRFEMLMSLSSQASVMG